MGQRTEAQCNVSRLGTAFHETFPLSRAAISQVLEVLSLAPSGGGSSVSVFNRLRASTTLGSNYVKAMPRYAMGCGLIDSKHRLTPTGARVLQSDPVLENPATQWLMHYHLSARNGPGPAFWHELVTSRFKSGDQFSAEEIATQVKCFYERREGKPLASRTARATATVFLGTYASREALGGLSFLKAEATHQYLVLEPPAPPMWAVAYAMVAHWHDQYKDAVSINLSDLFGEAGIASILMLGRGRLNGILEALQQEGILELHRIAPPYQVVLLRRNLDSSLGRLYGSGDA